MKLKITIEGPPGPGKTTIGCRIPAICQDAIDPCHILLFEKGHGTIEWGDRNSEHQVEIFLIQTSETEQNPTDERTWLIESQKLITNLRGWISTGKSETAVQEIDEYWNKFRARNKEIL